MDEEDFKPLLFKKNMCRILKVRSNRLTMEILITEDMKEKSTDYYDYAYFVSASFLMALNIASSGYFSWLSGNQLFWHCEHFEPEKDNKHIFFSAKPNTFSGIRRKLNAKEIKDVMMLFSSLMKDQNQHFRKEYLKGIVHLSLNFGDLSFSEEAFTNFYRSFELFISSQILGKERLCNEFEELQ